MRSEPTDAERRLWERLRRDAFGVKFKRQYAIGGYITDFCCPRHKLIIELDGGQHAEQAEYDNERTAKLQSFGYRIIRFWNSEISENIEGVLETIYNELNKPSP